MSLISPKQEKRYIYFDKINRTQLLQQFWSLIFASGWAYNKDTTESRKEVIKYKLKDSYEIVYETKSYGNDENKIGQQFHQQYTLGFDTGIWKDSDLNLSVNAISVFNGHMTAREYLTRFVCNLFEYIKDVGYVHPLYETCKYAVKNNKNKITVEEFYEILPLTNEEGKSNLESEFKQHIRIFMNYLKSTNLFIGDKNNVIFRNEFPPDVVLEFCNIEYQDNDEEATIDYFRDKENYSEYISKQLPNSYYEILYKNQAMNSEIPKFEINIGLKGAKNKIYYGAPGTGKSYKVDKEYPNYKRVTFHPEYTYYDFIGGLRPTQDEDSGNIKYEFVPGPFTDSLVNAIFDNENYHGIIIEELNRANTAAVFGDIFQLLDRDDDGKSKYTITNKDITDYIKKTKGVNIKEIVLPSNFSIIATMNSADQGVNVLDSAFKRRWQFEYMPINFDDSDLQDVKIAGFNVPWVKFGKILNNFMSEKDIDEDRLIGQRFITKKEIQDPDLVASKLLIYLWDDIFRYNRKAIFREHNVFSNLVKDYQKNGIDCFVEELSSQFKDKPSSIEEINENRTEYSSLDEEMNDD